MFLWKRLSLKIPHCKIFQYEIQEIVLWLKGNNCFSRTYFHHKFQEDVTIVCEHGTARVIEAERLTGRLFFLNRPAWLSNTGLVETLRDSYTKLTTLIQPALVLKWVLNDFNEWFINIVFKMKVRTNCLFSNQTSKEYKSRVRDVTIMAQESWLLHAFVFDYSGDIELFE